MKKVIVIFVFIIMSFSSFSQIDYYEQPENIQDTTILLRKFLYGLDFGFSVGQPTRIAISPKIAYPVLPWFNVGAGADGLYYSIMGFNTFMYGVNAFTDIFAFRIINFHFEYTQLNVETFKNYPNSIDREWITGVYAGAGYRQMLSDKAFITYQILWDFNYTEITPYANPTYRFTFYF